MSVEEQMQIAIMFSLEAAAALGAIYLAFVTKDKTLKRELFIASAIAAAVFVGHVTLARFFVD
ncbi:MAG: hypothetical protein KIT15_17140 [Xanthobacteraceae bacterium]|nr:hypothetical protein [Xanthobacteraceae bacterium]